MSEIKINLIAIKNIMYLKNIIRHTAMLLFFSLALAGCYYDKENELYPDQANCDTSGVMTYSQSVAPVMVANCNTCHSGANPEGGVITSNYDGLSVVANNGKLWAAVNHEGSLPMPQGGDKLPVCDLTKIKKWIDAGAPDN